MGAVAAGSGVSRSADGLCYNSDMHLRRLQDFFGGFMFSVECGEAELEES